MAVRVELGAWMPGLPRSPPGIEGWDDPGKALLLCQTSDEFRPMLLAYTHRYPGLTHLTANPVSRPLRPADALPWALPAGSPWIFCLN